MSLVLGLRRREELPVVVAEELDQIIASLQAQLGQPTAVPNLIQRIPVTFGSGATSASADIPIPVDLSEAEFSVVGQTVSVGGGGFPTVANLGYLDTVNTTGASVAVKRSSGTNDGGGAVTGIMTVQVVTRV